jgi:hypothetical protein
LCISKKRFIFASLKQTKNKVVKIIYKMKTNLSHNTMYHLEFLRSPKQDTLCYSDKGYILKKEKYDE